MGRKVMPGMRRPYALTLLPLVFVIAEKIQALSATHRIDNSPVQARGLARNQGPTATTVDQIKSANLYHRFEADVVEGTAWLTAQPSGMTAGSSRSKRSCCRRGDAVRSRAEGPRVSARRGNIAPNNGRADDRRAKGERGCAIIAFMSSRHAPPKSVTGSFRRDFREPTPVALRLRRNQT